MPFILKLIQVEVVQSGTSLGNGSLHEVGQWLSDSVLEALIAPYPPRLYFQEKKPKNIYEDHFEGQLLHPDWIRDMLTQRV